MIGNLETHAKLNEHDLHRASQSLGPLRRLYAKQWLAERHHEGMNV